MSDGAVAVTAVGQNAMAVENDAFAIPLQVKYVEAQTATVKRKRLDPETPKIQVMTPEKAEIVKRTPHHVITPTVESPLSEAPTPDASPMTETPNRSAKFQYDPNLSYAEKVAYEMIVTERVYLDNLKQIIDGFLDPATNNSELAVTKENIDDLFINVEEIYKFNWILLQDMEECEYNPVKLAECFVSQQIGFGVYTKYCTHYPRSMDVLLEWTQREDTANFIKNQQAALGHTLPLCSFLLKPVQRILKYHLLLGNIAKHYKQSEDEAGYEVIQKALSAMTNVAKHINDMKRKHEDALRSQEIQSVLLEYEGPNLTSYGSLVLEETFRLHGTKTGRYLLLFEKALLITKRRSDGTFTWKATIEYSNMMLADSVFREPLTFQVIPFDDRKMCYTFVSRDLDTKNIWLLELKQRLLDSYAVKVPTKAKEIILGKSRDCEKENTEPDNETKIASSPANTVKRAVNLRTPNVKEKDSNHNGTKLHKSFDSENRKSKEEDLLEDKASALMDSIRSPLRRKLRVFKKRKFSKEQMKQPKRVSWSSDDYEHAGENDLLSPCEDNEEEGSISEHQSELEEGSSETAQKNNHIETSNAAQEKDDRNSTESPVMDKTTMVSKPEKEDATSEQSPSATLPPMVTTKPITLPGKKRRLTKEDRAKSASMPAEELLSRASLALKEQRSFSLNGLEDNNSQKDLVKLRENSTLIRNRRLGSNEDSRASLEGHLRRNPGVDNLTDDINISTIEDESSMSHTMRCVSAAFSDISPNFSRGDSPTSSTEENSVTLDEESDDTGTFQEADTSGDETTPEELNGVDDNNDNNGQATTIWDRVDFTHTDNGNGLHDDGDDTSVDMSCIDKTTPVASETSSYNETLSDSLEEGAPSLDDISHDSSPRFNGIYQKVFQLHRSHSEDNLSSQPSVTDDDYRAHGLVTRSHSTESSPNQRWSNANPFAFALTPKKKIVIKDSLWETIKEDAEVTQIAIATTDNNELCARRRKKRKGRRKRASSENRGDRAEYDPGPPPAPRTTSLELLHYHSPPPKGILKMQKNQDLEADKPTNLIDTKFENTPLELKRPITEVREPENVDNDKTLRCVDDNVSEVPATVNYLCVEHVPPEESPPKETGSISSGRTSDILCDLEEELLQIEIIAAQSVKSIVRNAIDEVSGRNDQNTKMADNQFAATAVDNESSHSEGSVDEQNADTRPDNSISRHVEDAVEMRTGDAIPERIIEDKSMNRLHIRESDDGKKITFEESEPSTFTTDDAEEEVFKQKSSISESSNIKQKLEELRRRKRSLERKWSLEGKAATNRDKFGNMPNIRDRINVLKRSSWHETRPGKSRLDADVALSRAAPNVRNIMTRLEQFSSPDQPELTSLRGQLQTSLSIQERVNSLRNDREEGRHPSARRSNSMDEDMPTWQRLKDRIETLRGDRQNRDADHERDITISDGSHLTSPRQNDESKTVVIKRGWVQQFVQKLETGT